MAPAGLSAVLRSRQTNSLALQGSFTVAAFAGYLLLSLAQGAVCKQLYNHSVFRRTDR